MALDFKAMAQSIVEAIGGVDNVKNLTHCMTRLRFILIDETKANDEAIKKLPGVIGLVKQSGQYQVIVGNNVASAYAEIMKLGIAGGAVTNEANKFKEKLTPRKIGANILDAIIGTMSPLIPAIIGGSMIKLLAMILEMLGVLNVDSSTYNILTTIGDAPFFFLPILVAVSAAKKFDSNTYLSMAIAGLMVHPVFMDWMAKAAEGTSVTFAMIPMTSVKYTYTIIPAMVMAWLLKYIDRTVDRITPEVTKNFLKPMLILLIASPIAILLVGPAGVWVGTAISNLVFVVHDRLGWLAVAIVGALWPLLVMTGMHRVFTPTIVQTIADTGVEGMVMPSEIGANLSLGGVSLAVALKTKNHELRQTALAAASSAIIAGITEPALYGVAVRLKRPMIASVITGFVAGALAGIGGLASHSMAAPGLFTSVQFIDKNNPMSIVWIVIVMVVSVILSFVLTLVLGFEDLPTEELEKIDDNDKQVRTQTTILKAPVSGKVKKLSELRDEVFSKEILGKGFAIEPSDGNIVSPISGTITAVFPTKHAYGIMNEQGIEILIHIGIDTVTLDGKGFISKVKMGNKVVQGQLLAKVDFDAIKAEGLCTDTVVVITNSANYSNFNLLSETDIHMGEIIFEVSK